MDGTLKKDDKVIAKVLDVVDEGYEWGDAERHGKGILQTGAIQFNSQVVAENFPDYSSTKVLEFLAKMKPLELVVGSTVYTGCAVVPTFQLGMVGLASIYYCDKE